jgi:hypothetical protein
MADDKPSWMKHVDTWSALITALGSIAVPVMIYLLSDIVTKQQVKNQDEQHKIDQQNTERSLVIAAVGYLTEETQKKQVGGFFVINWLRDKNIDIPNDIMNMATDVAKSLPSTARQTVSTATDEVQQPAPAAASQQEAISQIGSEALGGLVPRLFIHIASDDQRQAAETLRRAVQALRLKDGRSIIVPGVQRVAHPTNNIQLRYLKKLDEPEAAEIALRLTGLLGVELKPQDFSRDFDSRQDVKRHTYELWLPPGPIQVSTSNP